MKQKIKGKHFVSFASQEKEKYFVFIYEVISWGKILKRPTIHYSFRVNAHPFQV